MCGIAGFLDTTARVPDRKQILTKMAKAVDHRGPDSFGIWMSDSPLIGFAHTRLAIQDLSENGHQPMSSHSDRYTITYNGEIYNAPDIREDLIRKSHTFRGHSDTETILAAIEEYGLEAAVKRFTGMFAFALWDKQERKLYLARDRLGEKPLYYGWQNGVFIFASELKSFHQIPGIRLEVDRNSLSAYLRFNYFPAPYSVYQGIQKLNPGHILDVGEHDWKAQSFTTKEFWSLRDYYQSTQPQATQLGTDTSPEKEIDRLDGLLKDAVSQRMLSDVPIGAFLSGGVDSSTIVAIMQQLNDKPVKTFTIGFEEALYNEAEHAKKVARHLGTEHTELYLKPKDALDVIPLLPGLYEEPFADTSQIPTYLISKLAREQVTVALSGDGGDELFCGYNRYVWGRKYIKKSRRLPAFSRKALAGVLGCVSPITLNRLLKTAEFMLPHKFRFATPGEKLHKFASILRLDNFDDVYKRLVSQWTNPSDIVLDAQESMTELDDSAFSHTIEDISRRMMYLDTRTYLPDDILTQVDRASMAVGLEARVPLLDHHLVEYAARLPTSLKLRDGKSKWILRQVLYKYVPESLIERPKMGFAVPIDSWLRGSLKDWAEELLSETRLRNDGFFQPAPIRKIWKEHLSGKRNHYLDLWSILMFQSWLDAQKDK